MRQSTLLSVLTAVATTVSAVPFARRNVAHAAVARDDQSGKPDDFPANCTLEYTVVASNVCLGIAAQFNITLDTLFSLNGKYIDQMCSNLEIGQILCISTDPADALSTSSTAPPTSSTTDAPPPVSSTTTTSSSPTSSSSSSVANDGDSDGDNHNNGDNSNNSNTDNNSSNSNTGNNSNNSNNGNNGNNSGTTPNNDNTISTGASDSSATVYHGVATFFFQNAIAGACGSVHSDSDLIVALETSMYSGGSNCGKTLTITNADTGVSITAIVADECPTCISAESIDLSQGAMAVLASTEAGMVNVAWTMS